MMKNGHESGFVAKRSENGGWKMSVTRSALLFLTRRAERERATKIEDRLIVC